jgi:hypothetical protein
MQQCCSSLVEKEDAGGDGRVCVAMVEEYHHEVVEFGFHSFTTPLSHSSFTVPPSAFLLTLPTQLSHFFLWRRSILFRIV